MALFMYLHEIYWKLFEETGNTPNNRWAGLVSFRRIPRTFHIGKRNGSQCSGSVCRQYNVISVFVYVNTFHRQGQLIYPHKRPPLRSRPLSWNVDEVLLLAISAFWNTEYLRNMLLKYYVRRRWKKGNKNGNKAFGVLGINRAFIWFTAWI